MQPSSTEAFESLEPCGLQDFGEYFSTFRKKAFRFESLASYAEETEIPYFERFKRGEPCPDDFNSEWLAMLRDAAHGGKTFCRVRYVPNGNPTPYLKFETEWGYRRSAEQGERISFIPRNISLEQFRNAVPMLGDFYLFDDEFCFLMHYDVIGRFLGVSRTPSSLTNIYSKFASDLQKVAVPLEAQQLTF